MKNVHEVYEHRTVTFLAQWTIITIVKDFDEVPGEGIQYLDKNSRDKPL